MSLQETIITVPANSGFLLASDDNFKFKILDEKGVEKKSVPHVDAEKGTLMRTRDAIQIVCHGKSSVVSVVTDISNALENLDVVPIEADMDESRGMTLQDKMKALIHDYAQNYFGDNQMDKLEDVLNVDLDDDGIIGTSEVPEMEPEIPQPPKEEPVPENPPPQPAESPPDQAPTP